MKPVWLFLTATGSVLSACLMNAEITVKPNSRALLRDFPLTLDISNSPALSRLPGLTNLPPSPATNNPSRTLRRPSQRFLFPPPKGSGTNDDEPAKSGVYLAQPYTMMVLVPGDHATGDAIKNGLNHYPGTNDRYIIRPEVHLEPLPGNSNSK